MDSFKLVSPYGLRGDQGQAVERLVEGLAKGYRFQTLLGVTGSGKTFTMANVIAKVNRPALVVSHNKILAAQLYSEFRGFFPSNAVRYFISYYDYYQPEAYIPSSDIYIEKDSSINDEINRLRLATTKALLERRDVIVVASVSCIYGIGSRKSYEKVVFCLSVGDVITRRELLIKLVDLYYDRNDVTVEPGNFRVKGDVIDLFPPYEENLTRIEMFGDEVDRIYTVDPVTGRQLEEKNKVCIYPAKHFVTDRDVVKKAIKQIEIELEDRLEYFRSQNKFLEAERLETRTRRDIEMLLEIGYCAGIENYSRYLSGREPGEPPGTLLDFFPEDFIVFIDESHITIPQLNGMYRGDRSRKQTLVDYGFRLPSALDNRPLTFEEFLEFTGQIIFVSATPGDYELKVSSQVVEQLIRPTGVVDPEIEIRPAKTQVDDLLDEIRRVIDRKERVLVTTLTKRLAENLAEYFAELGIKVRYMHSEIDALERASILKSLRMGEFDVLVGINLLREGLDLPEVGLVAILDADKTGFLRSARSLIQTMGRAARNVRGKVILYADEITPAIREAKRETDRRRRIQLEYNKKHNIKPKSIVKPIKDLIPEVNMRGEMEEAAEISGFSLKELEKLMWKAVDNLDFEKAAFIRDEISRKYGQNNSKRRKRA
ncbi:MAG: excinuclease ABC subunit UvrB [Synergistetes bacterium]|nr:excinuclease ABC subunit UvrB [Synergistota bacterium]